MGPLDNKPHYNQLLEIQSVDYPDSESSGAVTMLKTDGNDEPPPQQQQEVSQSPPQQQQETASPMSPQLSSGAIHASMSAGGNPMDDGNEGGDTNNVLFTFFLECVEY
ncbi:hypothetical protein ACFE04_018192 [Oxalis oulophora]